MSMLDTEYGLRFGKPKIVMTRIGEREVRDADVTEEFWTAWRADKEGLKKAGYGVSKNPNGDWKVSLWAETMSVAERETNHAASKAANSDIKIPLPEGLELFPFQVAGVAYALAREGTLIGDEMGLGKTVQAIGFVNATASQRVLVVAPASLLGNWRSEINKWQMAGLPVHIVRAGCSFPDIEAGWVVINYDIVGRYEAQLRAKEWDTVVLDECQYLKSRNAKRTLALLGGGKGEGKREPVPAKRKILLTGTPIMNRPAEMFPLLHYLDAKRWGTWSAFVKRYCGGGWNGYAYDSSGASNLDELQSRLRETVMVRRLKADVLKELPAKIRQIVTLDVDDERARAAVEAENAAAERTESDIASATYAMQKAESEGDEHGYKAAVEKLKQVQGIAFSEMAKVRHETALAKVPAVIEHLKATEGSVIVFAHHRDVVDQIVKAVKDDGGVVSITGDTPTDRRQDIVREFQSGAVRFFVGNIKAAGVGLTLTKSSHVIFAELDWTPSSVSQAEDRAHRIGQRDSVLVQHLVFDGSLDARMAKMLVAKQKVIDQALDNQEGAKVYDEAPLAPVQPIVVKEKPKADPISLTPDQVAATHAALRIVAAYDSDRARAINGVGFSKLDTQFGCELAARHSLTPRQAAAARKMIRKYRRQYPSELYDRMFGGEQADGEFFHVGSASD